MRVPEGTATIDLSVAIELIKENEELNNLISRLGWVGEFSVDSLDRNIIEININKVKKALQETIVNAILCRMNIDYDAFDIDIVRWIEEGGDVDEPQTT